MIKAVLFDVDGVLIDSLEANFQFYRALFIKAGYSPPTKRKYLPFMHNTMEGVVQNITHASDKEVQRIVDIGKEFGEELYPYTLLKTPLHIIETLQQLYTKYMIGIVTSRVKDHIYSLPVLSPLEEIFQVTVSFEDTKRHKPDPDPLLFAARGLQIEPEEAVYIGDAQSDFLAAKKAGMKFILFGKENFLHGENHTDSFEKLPELITKL